MRECLAADSGVLYCIFTPSNYREYKGYLRGNSIICLRWRSAVEWAICSESVDSYFVARHKINLLAFQETSTSERRTKGNPICPLLQLCCHRGQKRCKNDLDFIKMWYEVNKLNSSCLRFPECVTAKKPFQWMFCLWLLSHYFQTKWTVLSRQLCLTKQGRTQRGARGAWYPLSIDDGQDTHET